MTNHFNGPTMSKYGCLPRYQIKDFEASKAKIHLNCLKLVWRRPLL